MKTNGTRLNPTAEICMYGARHCGFAFYIASPTNPTLGGGGWNAEHGISGEFSTLTTALWAAMEALEAAGFNGRRDVFRLHDVEGTRAADLYHSERPSYGSIQWLAPTEVYVVSAEEIERAAAGQ